MRWYVPVDVQQVRQQQIVNVAAVAGNINYFFTARIFFKALEVIEFDAIEYSIPKPGEYHIGKTHGGIGIVCCDFTHRSLRLGSELFGCCIIRFQPCRHGSLYAVTAYYLFEQSASV